MKNNKLFRLVAICTACLSLGVFAFSGCKKNGDETGGTGSGVEDTDVGGGSGSGTGTGEGSGTGTGEGSGTGEGTGEGSGSGPSTGKDPTKPGDPIGEPEDAKIEGPVQGGPKNVTASKGELETAYVTWTAADNAKWYNVYCSPAGANSWTKLDAPLVRQYKDYFRADAVGLKAGSYDMKIVPVSGEDTEATEYSATASGITVYAHDRSGFAFVKGTSSGAYNEDGTLRDNANVIYITETTKNTVSLNVTGANANPCVGLQQILNGYKKAKETKPLSVRLIGNITDLTDMEKGDVLIDGAKAGVTFEGIGGDATCNGWGLRIKGASNVEVRNLGFMNCNSGEGDNVGLQQDNDHVWVHNCDMYYGDAGSDADQVKGDGALDTKTSAYVTHSYNHFWDSGKCNLQGMKGEETTNYITYHHNWYDHSDSRHPRIRTCTVHTYNNYFDGNAKYGVGVTMGASAFVENNYFRSTVKMKPMLSSMQGTDALGEGTFSGENGGVIKSFGNKYEGEKALILASEANKTDFDCYEAATRSEQVPSDYKTKAGGTAYNNFDTADSMYEYAVDTPDVAREKVERYAGRMGGGDIVYEFDNATQDGNYEVIPELKALLTSYKSGLVKVANETVTGGGTGSGSGTGDGGDSGGTTTDPVTQGTVIIFAENDPSIAANGVIITGGSYGKAAGFTVNGKTYTTSYKISDGTIKFTLDGNYKMIIHLTKDGTSDTTIADGKRIKVNGEEIGAVNSCVTVNSITGSVVLTKGDSARVCYIELIKI